MRYTFLPRRPSIGAAFAVAWFVSFGFLFPLRAAETLKPNVIFIMADDQGSVDAGCYGAKDLITPAMDSLAAHGVRFTQFYSAAPVCSPSRAGFLTGRYPWLAGMPNNGAAPPTEADDQLDTLTGEGLPASEGTIADMFRAAGYATAHIGKWHLGSGAGHKPLDHGFDYSFGFMGGCIDNYTHFFYWDGPNRLSPRLNKPRVKHYSFECVPSQNGMVLECLQAHHATVLASLISTSFGSRPVPLCEPSQKG